LPDVIFGILEDAGKNFWLSSPQGVVRISGSPKEAIAHGDAVNAESYGTSDGMETRECSGTGHPSSLMASDGTLWFATVRGVSSVDPNHLVVNRVPPLLSIEQVSLDDQPVQAAQDVRFEPGNHRVVFHFAALSFVAPQKVRYKYRLDGFDRDWIDAGTRREASYTNLSPGRYRFRVMAANNDGVWSESSADFPFYQRPHLYRTLWFYALCVALAGFIGYQLYRMRLRHMRSQFDVVLAERTRIARDIHDTLAQDFIGISVQLEILASMLNISVDAAKAQLDQARASVREAVANARRSVWSLRSQALDRGDLPSAISETLRHATQNSGIKATFETNGTYRPAPVETEDQILRIAQEAISNAVRHSGANTLDVRLQYSDDAVRLRVQDDGRGFDTSTRRNGHFGLVGMRERAQQIGADLDVESAVGQGTTVAVEVRMREKTPRSQPSAAR
jgi:signal transduction histidine kinase